LKNHSGKTPFLVRNWWMAGRSKGALSMRRWNGNNLENRAHLVLA